MSQSGGPCDPCVHWSIAAAKEVPGRSFEFSDGSTVTVDMHGVRYLTSKAPPHRASEYLLRDRPEEAIQLPDKTIAWLDENGWSTHTATPLGPAIASFPAPALPPGEKLGSLYTSRHAFFVVGDRGSLYRSTDGGRKWSAIPLGLPRHARFVAIGGKDELGGEDEETCQANQRKGDSFLALWYHPMWYLESNDEGQTWSRKRPSNWVRPREKRHFNLPVVPKGYEDDDANDRPEVRLDLGTFVAGNSLLHGRFVPGKGVDFDIGPVGGPSRQCFLAFPGATEASIALVAGQEDAASMVLDVTTPEASRWAVYHRDDRASAFVALPRTPAIAELEPESILAGRGVTLMVGRKSAEASHHVWMWSESQPPREVEISEPTHLLFDRARQNLWGWKSDGTVWRGPVDATTGSVKVIPVPGFLGPLHRATGDGRLDTGKVWMSAFSVNIDGTFHCVVQAEPDYVPHLVRVRADGTPLPILRLPFAQRRVNIGQSALGFWGSRGYSSAGWETADAGEHWTRVDAWPLARNVECLPSGCLVDQARRIGWVLPAAWRQGEPAVALGKASAPPATIERDLLFRCEALPGGQAAEAPFRANLWKACVPGSAKRARWGFIEIGERGDPILTVGLADGQSEQVTLLTSKEPSAQWATTIGCDERGAFAIHDPHQKLRNTEAAQHQPWREPCAAVAYYRWTDGVVRRAGLPCRGSRPWDASSGMEGVAVADGGLLLTSCHPAREDEKPKPESWILLSETGAWSLIREAPTSQSVASALRDGHDLWVFSQPKYGMPGDLGGILGRFDGTSWREQYLALSPLSFLLRIDGRPALATFDLPGTVTAGERPPPDQDLTLTPLGFLPLPLKEGELPTLREWPSPPAAGFRRCGAEADGRPSSWWRPGLRAKVQFGAKAGAEFLEVTATRLRLLADGSSCAEAIVAGDTLLAPGQYHEPFNTGGILIFPHDPEHSWFVIKALTQFGYAPARCRPLPP